MNETTPAAGQEKAALRRELEATHTAYREVVGAIAAARWNARSGNPGWTCGQLAWHLASGVKFSTGLIENARKGKGTNPPSFLLPLGYKANEFLVRRNSRKATRDSVLADYATALAQLLRLLDGVQDHEFALSATNFGQTKTIREMFHLSAEHFEEHGPEIKAAL